jgi:FlaA1/EpsC-like NDP-sugar epimerase
MHSQLNGKRIALFGASGGIGNALCRYILSLGGALITVDRNPKKSAALVQALRSEFPQGQITPLLADLEELSQA